MKKRKIWSWAWKIGGTLLIAFIIGCDLLIDSVVQPASINGGTVLNVQVNAHMNTNADQTSAVVFGILVPKLWNASANTTVTFTSDITSGQQPMTLIPPGTPAPNGNGLSWQDDLMGTIGHAGNLI